MPIYESYCPDNHKIYSFLARSLSYADKTPRCPDNPSYRLERLVSAFAVVGKAKEPSANEPGLDADDPRLERAMMEMEREMGSMDENNPDPRQLARMMRRMSSLTGENLGAPMEEMIGRLEAGEDPGKLEEEFADLPEDSFGGDPSGASGEQEGAMRRRMRGLLRGSPRRDPQLYAMRDYAD